jgi:hypothetical protein
MNTRYSFSLGKISMPATTKTQIDPIANTALIRVLFMYFEAKFTNGAQRYARVNPTINGKHILENM